MASPKSAPPGPRTPLVIGHRGAPRERPENTLAGLRRAIEAGAAGIEVDVRLTSDGVPVLFHDPALRRLTGSRGRLDRTSFEALRALRVAGEPIATLEEALQLAAGRAVLMVEIKPGIAVEPVVGVIRRRKAAFWSLAASFEEDLLRQVRAQAPELTTVLVADPLPGRLTPERAAERFVARMNAAGASALSLNWKAVKGPAFVEALHRRMTSLWCWTVNSPELMRRLADWGVDGILSDDPALLARTLSDR